MVMLGVEDWCFGNWIFIILILEIHPAVENSRVKRIARLFSTTGQFFNELLLKLPLISIFMCIKHWI